MKPRIRVWPRFASTLIVAVAVAIVWVTAGVWFMSSIEQRMQRNAGFAHETLQITRDGTPLIESRAIGDYTAAGSIFRTLDGQVVDIGRENLHTRAVSIRPRESDRPPFLSIGWNARVASISDSQRQGVDWYLVRAEDPLGPAYFVGYDEQSKLRVGFIGNGGFRLALPPQEEWFNLPRRELHQYYGAVASSGNMANGGRGYNYYSNYVTTPPPREGAQPWQVFVIDGDKLLEIDLRTRGVRTVFEAPGLESVAIFYEPTPTPRTNQAELADAAEADAAGAAVAPAEAVIADGPLIPHIILRAGDRLVILNPATAVQREYQLPAELLEKYLSLYSLPDGTFLANSAERNSDGGTSLDLLWLAPDFRITRQETVQLAAMPQFSMRQMAWMVGAVVPAPIIWFAFIGIAMPHEPSLVAAQFSYSGAIAHVIGQVWPTALAVAAAGALMVWFTYRQQRTYHRPLTAAWCAFVLLFGLPGLIAYLIEYRRTKLESCSECNAIVPRDREACADCETPFATPRLTGTEIFA